MVAGLIHSGTPFIWIFQIFESGASLSEPHSYVESGAVVHAQRTAMKNGIATHYCSLGAMVHVQTR